eukprot:11909180-Karenia_brevis.AAC.1
MSIECCQEAHGALINRNMKQARLTRTSTSHGVRPRKTCRGSRGALPPTPNSQRHMRLSSRDM